MASVHSGKMAMNRMRSAMATPRKGETFELRAGLVYVQIRDGHFTHTDLVQVSIRIRKVKICKFTDRSAS